MSVAVKLSNQTLINQWFVQAVQVLADARKLSPANHKAAVNLIKVIKQKLDELNSLKTKDHGDKLPDWLIENTTIEDCTFCAGVSSQASLSPKETIAIEPLIGG
jgi:hypothetical protein